MKRENDPSAPKEAAFNWYPGHMAKALREIKQKLQLVDIVFEIRDARAPVVSGNNDLYESLGNKCKFIILNKANFVDQESLEKWKAWFGKQGDPFLFVNCLDRPSMGRVIGMARKIVEENRKKCNPDEKPTKSKLRIMIVGLPNTGKSTIINTLAKKNAAKVADKPGQTLIQQWIPIENDVELLDTPGVMPPKIEREEHALWLSAIHAIPDDVSDEQTTATFLVKHYLKHKVPKFFERYKIDPAETNLDEVFVRVATARGCLRQKGMPDLERVYKLILSDFRSGELGQTCFSVPL